MTTFYVNLEAISPLAIRADHATSRSGSSDHIPGNTLLGALATVHRVFREKQEAEFERLFLRGETLYSNLYPATFDPKDSTLQEDLPVYPLPGTAQSCKRHEGFLPLKGDHSEGHGVRDTLVDWAMFRLGKMHSPTKMLLALEKHKNCEKCGEPMHHFESYYRYSTNDAERMVKAKNLFRLQTHTGIDRQTGTVRENVLYNRQVFEEGAKFWGEIRLPDDKALVESFTKFIIEVNKSHFLRLGTGRTRGMGKVDINIQAQPIDTQDRFTKFKERLNELDKYIHDTIKEVWQEEPFNDAFFFALTLHSPAILIDDLLRYHSSIDANTLSELLDPGEDIGLEECYTNTSTKRITGWQELWGTPRTNEYAIDTGSVFLFQCHKDKGDKLIKKLFRLEEQGIGKRRAEGFGRIRISDQFHTKGKQKQ